MKSERSFNGDIVLVLSLEEQAALRRTIVDIEDASIDQFLEDLWEALDEDHPTY